MIQPVQEYLQSYLEFPPLFLLVGPEGFEPSKLVGVERIELSHFGLKDRCSTTELHPLEMIKLYCRPSPVAIGTNYLTFLYFFPDTLPAKTFSNHIRYIMFLVS